MVGLSLFSFSVAIDAFLKILDALVYFILLNALLTYRQVGRTSLAVILMHH